MILGEPKEAVREKALQLLDRLGLRERASHKPSQLSGGESQRVAVARALINEPAVIFADEPSGSLDTANKESLHQLIFDLRRELGQTFVIVTHDPEFARRADRMIVLKDGRIESIEDNPSGDAPSVEAAPHSPYAPPITSPYAPPTTAVEVPSEEALSAPSAPETQSKPGQVNPPFAGNGGPSVSNPFNRLLYAAKFREANILFSQEVREGSQILYDRDPAKRVAKVAPWLTLDNSPYPAVVDHDDNPATPKRVMWIVDGYTTTNNYPYAQHESLAKATATADNKGGLLRAPEESNYVRNSVKAVVDAYDGSVKLYQWDDKDPILKAWQKVFPGTVTPMSQMSADLIAHMRYPEDLFNVQRTMMATYHVNDAAEFYSGGDFWKIPDDPTTPGQDQQAPYYLTLKMPGQDQASFSLSSAYIIGGNTNRNVLTGFLAVDSETSPGTGKKGERSPSYGKLRLLELPRSSNVAGPGQVQNIFDSNPEISKELNLLSQEGSQVIKGNLLTLPVGGGLLYVQPVYVQSSSGTQYPLLRKVLVSFGDNVGFADTLSGALDQVFGGNSGATTGQEAIDGDAAAANDTNETTDGKDPTADDGAKASASPSATPTASASASPSASASASSSSSATPSASGTSDPKAELNQALSDAQTAMTDADNARSKGDWSAYGDAQRRLNEAVNRAVEAQKKVG